MNPKQAQHTPVLLQQVLKLLDPRPGDIYLDLTAGYGGHAQAVRNHTGDCPMVLVDRDDMAVGHLKKIFTDENVSIRRSDFLKASRELEDERQKFDIILADLGVSSPHLNMASRGFAFNQDGPLDMRMDRRQQLTAETIVNTFAETELVHILREYGEEPKARRIAHAITVHRPIHTTQELAKVVAAQWPGKSKVHPATKTFQALRIAVNDELMQLGLAIPIWIKLLKPGGRLGVISFHSLEDRMVKQAFAELSGNRYDAVLSLLTKSPITADKNEIVSNPRSRSAKLRVAAKIKT